MGGDEVHESEESPHGINSSSTVRLKTMKNASYTWKDVLGPLSRICRDATLIKLCLLPKMRFVAAACRDPILKMSFLAPLERSNHSLHTILSPHNSSFYSRMYHGADYLGDAYLCPTDSKRTKKHGHAIFYCTTQAPRIPVVAARIYPKLSQNLIITVSGIPRELMFPDSYAMYRFSRPLLRMAICTLSPKGHIRVKGNVYTHPLFGKHLDLYDIQDPLIPGTAMFESDNHEIYIRADMLAHQRLFLLIEFTFLADLNKEGESNIPLIEVSRGVSFLRLSPMEDFSQSFMEGVQQSMMSLPKLLDKHEAKMQRRRADDDFMRIYDLVDILNLVGCTKNDSKLVKLLQSASKNVSNPNKQKQNLQQYSPVDQTSIELPIFEFSVSDPLTTLVDGTSFKRWKSKPSRSCSLVLKIKPIHIRDVGPLSRLPGTMIVPPRCLFLLDHITAAYASMLVGPQSHLQQANPQLGRLCVRPVVDDGDTSGLAAMLRSSSGSALQFPAEIATLTAIVKSFGRQRAVIQNEYPVALSGSALLYFFAAIFEERVNEVPRDLRYYMNQSVLLPVSLNITDNIFLGTFIRCLRYFQHSILREMAAMNLRNEWRGDETTWDKEYDQIVRLLSKGQSY
ncbi:hypothetical protein GL50803_0088065 [Giardia duodenalis]|uniref:Uncharacterized protein n=1 Tax=Giardia intestinalis (strain ATCC 50803 / WB clone C6) TaxID=184922 RepID=A8B216_GIAIC|nr:hypothetical protein GL50803_0088065 [Giardia intestinalis]KAE8302904.1 hypothetical protein GL50803_0088065 [Giardia intestinalis]|eukprot:XP_001709880.1 Hypothetical protein GL50803_88065 [Giardia lamblia ATCC 50803]